MAPRKSSDPLSDRLRELLRNLGVPRDDLPYTDQFDSLKAQFESDSGESLSAEAFWRRLSTAGKKGGVAETGRRRGSPAPKLTRAEQLELLRLFPDGIGNRDQLPYTKRFEDVYRRFNQLTRRKLTKHEFWRALSSLAKRSRKPRPLFDTAPLGGLSEDFVRALDELNPWWSGRVSRPSELYRRWAFSECRRRLTSRIAPVIAIRGTRQVGKTEIQLQLIEELIHLDGIPPRNVLRVQFDDLPSIGAFKEPLLAVVRWYEDNVLGEPINAVAAKGEDVYLFFDELQNLPAWEAQLKFVADNRAARMIATGSSALRIGQGQDSLAGRLSLIELGTLRLREIAGIRKEREFPPYQDNGSVEDWTRLEFWRGFGEFAKSQASAIRGAFKHFSNLGGYPICHKTERANASDLADLIVSMVVERTLLRDLKAGQLGSRRDLRVVEETFRRVCRYAGQAVQPARIQQELDAVLQSGVSLNAVVDALRFLEDSMLVRQIPALEAVLKKQASPNKFCLCDHFLREAWLQERIPLDAEGLSNAPEAAVTLAGRLIESVIGYYLTGISGLDISWFPERMQEPEVDFVITFGLSRIPLEVKYRRRPVNEQDLRGVRSFCAQTKYNAPLGLIVTLDEFRFIDDQIVALPAYALLAMR